MCRQRDFPHAIEIANLALQITEGFGVDRVVIALGVDFRRRQGTREWDNVAHARTAFPAWALIKASMAAAMVARSW
jgi:hypothetical protein